MSLLLDALKNAEQAKARTADEDVLTLGSDADNDQSAAVVLSHIPQGRESESLVDPSQVLDSAALAIDLAEQGASASSSGRPLVVSSVTSCINPPITPVSLSRELWILSPTPIPRWLLQVLHALFQKFRCAKWSRC